MDMVLTNKNELNPLLLHFVLLCVLLRLVLLYGEGGRGGGRSRTGEGGEEGRGVIRVGHGGGSFNARSKAVAGMHTHEKKNERGSHS